jgi:hypothetical protein
MGRVPLVGVRYIFSHQQQTMFIVRFTIITSLFDMNLSFNDKIKFYYKSIVILTPNICVNIWCQ